MTIAAASARSGLGSAVVRARHVTSGGRAAAAAIGRIRAGAVAARRLAWEPALVSLVRPGAALVAPPPDLDLLGAVVDRVVERVVVAGPADDARFLRPAARPVRRAAGRPGRAEGPATVRPTSRATPPPAREGGQLGAASVSVAAGAAAALREAGPRRLATVDDGRWTGGLAGRPLAGALSSRLASAVVDPSSPSPWPHDGAPSVSDAPSVALRAARPRITGALGGAGVAAAASSSLQPASATSTATATAPASTAPAPNATAGSPTGPGPAGVWRATPPVAGGDAAGGLRGLVQRWTDPAPADARLPAAPSARPDDHHHHLTPSAPTDAVPVAVGGPALAVPGGPVDLMELADAIDELLAQEAETHGLDGRVL